MTVNSRQGESTGNGNITGDSLHHHRRSADTLRAIISSQDLGATSVFGPIEIISTSGVPLIAVSRVYNATGHTSGFFNLEPLPCLSLFWISFGELHSQGGG